MNMVKKIKKMFFCIVMLVILLYSVKIYYERENQSVSVGNFGDGINSSNVTLRDAFENTIFRGKK